MNKPFDLKRHKSIAAKTLMLASLAGIYLHPTATAAVWNYNWQSGVDALDGNNDAGTWQSVSMSQDDQTGVLSVDISLSLAGDSNEPTEALWMSITNGPTPEAIDASYAALYLIDGNVYATPYTNSPVEDHALDTIIWQSTYDTSGSADSEFHFTVDTNLINAWSGGGSDWKGIGFPFDAQGNTAGNSGTPYRMGAWIRSYEADGADLSGTDWDISWGEGSDLNIGLWDAVHDFGSPVPEPSSALLGLLAGALFLLKRRR